jgi:hypothetical protein
MQGKGVLSRGGRRGESAPLAGKEEVLFKKRALLAAAIFAFVPTAFPASGEAPPQQASPQSPDPFQLALILKAGREYSRRLGNAALDFVCVEQVTDRIDLGRDGPHDLVRRGGEVMDMSGGSQWDVSRGGGLRFDRDPKSGKGMNVFIFDYQFVRQAGEVKESRKLLKKNGKDAKRDEPLPRTAVFQYADILMAPVQILDEKFRDFYRYRLVREDALEGVKCWVVEVAPSLPLVESYLGGTVWLRQDDYSILKIEWDPETYSGYEKIRARAKSLEAEPRVVSLTEFGVEKNGIRFPSRDFTQEAYLLKDGRLFVRSETEVVYKDYRFFTVETSTELKK